MADGFPDLPPLQKVPFLGQPGTGNGYSANSEAKRGGSTQTQEAATKMTAPPIKRGMKSGQKELEQIIARSRLSNYEDAPAPESPHAQGDQKLTHSNTQLSHQQADEMPLLALDPQNSIDSNFMRQTTNVMNIEVRTPDLPTCKLSPFKNSQSTNTRRTSGQVLPLKQQVMNFAHLQSQSEKTPVDEATGGQERASASMNSHATVIDVGFNKNDIKLNL